MNTQTHTSETTHFGFQEVPRTEKVKRVRGVFDSVASRYDVMNDLMSAGLHRYWKHEMVGEIPLRPDIKLLDLAGGTGDIAFRFLEHCNHKQIISHVTVSDINASMLQEGVKRAIDRNYVAADLRWLCANAESLPLPNHQFDACTIAFGIRNVTDIPQALREIFRVLKHGGKFMCLEFSPLAESATHPASRFSLSQLYDFYSFQIIPRLGKMVTGDADSYQYLVESIRRFPSPIDFKQMLEAAGFSRVSYQTFTFGVVALHIGWKV
jgi:ubiquinone/menaquinone biosynthesis methyltransferase